jgi:chromatin remodeling complex protein RSC6
MKTNTCNNTTTIQHNEVIINKQPDMNICDHFQGIIDSLGIFKSQISNLQQQLRNLEKNVKKQMKTLQKDVAKNKNKGNRKPSGFAKPSKVTNELCEFMNKKEGTEIARTEVTRALCNYIKENKLENKENNKIISPDDKLKTLLGIEEGQELTYFTIQKFMNKHFI